jgi:hypothetical protein
MYLQICYYKFNMSSLINLIQPCHLILLLEGIALVSDGPLGIMIATLILPSLTGTLLAIFFPDTSGLHQPFEEQSYWIQHYLIITVPIYLLQRRRNVACDMCSPTTIFIGLWILAFLHWSLYEVRAGCVKYTLLSSGTTQANSCRSILVTVIILTCRIFHGHHHRRSI